MKDSHNSFPINRIQNFIKVSLYTVAALFIWTQTVVAQGNFLPPPVIDGVINAQQLEYGNNEENHDRRTSGPVIWWITWNDDNFFVANRGLAAADGSVCYFDRNPISPVNGGTNVDGTLAGLDFGSGARFGTLPFRADYALFSNSTGRQAYQTDLAGGWTSVGAATHEYAAVGNEREHRIPWNAISSGNGRPTSFLFFCYAVTGSSVVGQVPLQNPGGAIGTNAVATHFYRIYDSIDPINKPPFWVVASSAPPTSARGSITGIVKNKTGRAVPRVQVDLIGDNGEMYRTMTNGFGYFTFEEVPFGGFYVIQVGVNKYNSTSDQRTFQFSESISTLEFILP